MPKTDDKARGPQVREASRLRATLGSEPSSGYAFHDHVRVERVRPGQREPGAQAASHAPRERAFAQTLVGGVTIQEVLANQQLAAQQLAAQALTSEASTLPPENDQGELSAARVSWPPMPQVPRELEGSVVDALPSAPEPSSQAEIATGVHPVAAVSSAPAARSSAPPGAVAGGAIWEAMPSLVDAAVALEGRGSAREQDLETTARRDSAEVLRSSVRSGSPEASGMSSKAAAYRPSAAELEAEHAHAYGDLRLLKYEKLVERNAWELLAEQLSAEVDPSPALQLLRIVAQREMLKGDQKAEAARLAREGIGTIARLLDLPEGSPTALVLGKRLLRRNPWAPKKQASAGLSIGLLLCGLAVGAAIGWLITALLF